MYAQLAFALDRAAEMGQPVSLEQLHAGGMRVIGSVGGTEFRVGPAGPELVKSAAIQVINDVTPSWAAAPSRYSPLPPRTTGP
jgi:hypothetical protein